MKPSGFSAATWGYAPHFVLCIALNLLCVLTVVRWLTPPVPDVALSHRPS